MKLSDYISFLKNKSIKVKSSFVLIIFLAITIVIADALSIFSLLPLTSLLFETDLSLDQTKNYSEYIPNFLKDFLKKINTWMLFTILLLIIFLRNLLHLFYNYIIFRFVKFYEVDTSRKIFFLWLNKSYLDFYKNTSSELVKDFRDSIGGYVMFVESVTRFISDLIILIMFGLFLLYISFNETLIIFLYYILIFFVFKKIVSKLSYRYGEISNLSSNKINLSIINTFKNFSQIILRKLETNFLNLISDYVNKFSYSRLIISFIKSNTKQFFEISIIFFIFIFFSLFNFLEIYSTEEIVSLLAIFIIAAYRILPQINNLVASLIKIKNYEYPFKIIDKQINFFNHKYKEISLKHDRGFEYKFEKAIELKNVGFSFKDKDKKILNNLNLKIKKNETVGFVGKSGLGKTTIIKILLGLITPDQGELILDDKLIKQKDIRDYQTLFSYLSQENLFIPGSIKENVAFGEKNVDEKKLYEALKITNCLEFIEKLENKINHIVIEDGKNFSIGQLQRLALARAIYFNNQVLILDEPTSALDGDSEIKFLNLIDDLKSKKTIIIISHKKDTLKNCDNIYEIQDKKLVKLNTD